MESISADQNPKDHKVQKIKKEKVYYTLRGVDGTSETNIGCEKDVHMHIPSKGLLQNQEVDISSFFSCPTFTCKNTRRFHSAMAATETYVFVGVKYDGLPHNLYDFSGGVSLILVYDHNFKSIAELQFEHGIPVQIHAEQQASSHRIISLFNNGTLIEFTFNSGPASSENISNLQILSANGKIVKFSVLKDTLAYTDGARLFIRSNGNVVSSLAAEQLIIDLAVVEKGSEEIFVILTRNGLLLYCDKSMLQMEEITRCRSFDRIFTVPDAGTILLLDTIEMKWRDYRVTRLKPKKKIVFVPEWNGAISACRIFSGRLYSKKLFQVVSLRNSVLFCVHPAEFNEYVSCRLHICGLVDVGGYFIAAYENGLLIKVPYE